MHSARSKKKLSWVNLQHVGKLPDDLQMSDLTDDRRGAYDPVTKDGLRQLPQVKDTTTPSPAGTVGCGCKT
jgi:hypothetical protein